MIRRRPPRLVALTTGDASRARGGALERAVAAALEAGLPGLLVREPGLEDREYLALAARLRELAQRLGDDVWFGVHDRVHLATELGAHAVHLGSASLAPAVAREMLRDDVAIGFSSHADDAPERWNGADHLFLSPIRATSSKPGAVALGMDALSARSLASGRPVLALGGIGPEHASAALAAGAHGVVARSGLLGADDPSTATRRYLEAVA